ncbi:MAG TPA: glycosyltransferase family A protein [Levilinea sp.]|nr:glycosyltransferase family A protein [Levilinea sp.]
MILAFTTPGDRMIKTMSGQSEATNRVNAARTAIFCSTIIPTIGRATLARAVESVLAQVLSAAEFEIIVINDSGTPLTVAAWQASARVQIIETNRRERSVARNTGAVAARGKYLHFLDDDDWLAAGALERFYQLSQSTTAVWMYGITQLVDRQNQPLIQLRHGLSGNCFVQAMAGEWIPLQASLVERNAFLRAGGFNPLISGPEDIDLLRRMLLEAGLAETPQLVAYVAIGDAGSTTDYRRHTAGSRWSREAIIDAAGAFQRMRQSACSPFWQGRMLRLYLTSTTWNLQRRRFFSAASRCLFALRSALSAGTALFSPDYWKAVARSYESITFEQGQEAARQVGSTNRRD